MATLDFAGYTFLNAYKVEAISVDDDPNDNTATIKHRITFNPAGVPTIEDGLYYVAPASLPSDLRRRKRPPFRSTFLISPTCG